MRLESSSTRNHAETEPVRAPREVIRHPDIYAERRTTVATAPAARSKPEYLEGERRQIALPGERRQMGWFGWLIVFAVLASVVVYLVR